MIYRPPGPTVVGKVSLPVFAASTTSRSTHLPSFLQFGANCEQISNYAHLKLKLKNVILSRGNSRCRISRVVLALGLASCGGAGPATGTGGNGTPVTMRVSVEGASGTTVNLGTVAITTP